MQLPRHTVLVAAVSMLAAALTVQPGRADVTEQPAAAADCAGLFDKVHKLRAATLQLLEEVRQQRMQAEHLGKWLGQEEFQFYITALRDQERTLEAKLSEMANVRCPTEPSPFNAAPR